MQTVDFNSDVSVRVIGCDAGTTLMKNANNREKCVCMRVCMCVYARVCVCGGRGDTWDFSVLSTQCFHKPKNAAGGGPVNIAW